MPNISSASRSQQLFVILQLGKIERAKELQSTLMAHQAVPGQ